MIVLFFISAFAVLGCAVIMATGDCGSSKFFIEHSFSEGIDWFLFFLIIIKKGGEIVLVSHHSLQILLHEFCFVRFCHFGIEKDYF